MRYSSSVVALVFGPDILRPIFAYSLLVRSLYLWLSLMHFDKQAVFVSVVTCVRILSVLRCSHSICVEKIGAYGFLLFPLFRFGIMLMLFGVQGLLA